MTDASDTFRRHEPRSRPRSAADRGEDGGAPPGRDDPGKPAGKGKPAEIGGPKGPDPTRFGDWEIGGRCIDF